MKTLVITGSSESMLPVMELTLPSKQEWCAKHGYDLHVVRGFIGNGVFDSMKNIGFIRVSMALRAVSFMGYDRAIWIDADSIITNKEITHVDLCKSTKAPFIGSTDWWTSGGYISTGNFIVQSSLHSNQLGHEFYLKASNQLDRPDQEQGILNEMRMGSTDLFHEAPHNALGSVPMEIKESKKWNSEPRDEIVSPWKPGDFLAHFTGADDECRIRIISEFIEKNLL